MRKFLSFKEFLNITKEINNELCVTLLFLSESHPIIKNHPVTQKLLNDKNTYISVLEIKSVHEAIIQRNVQIAKAAKQADTNQRLLIIAEQNVLNNAATALSCALCARTQILVDRFSRRAEATW